MPAYFDQGFFVREPAWHQQGVVLDDYPSREEAMRLAGHDFTLVKRDISVTVPADPWPYTGLYADSEPPTSYKALPEWTAIVREDTGAVLNVAKSTYEIIPNEVGYDLMEAILGETNVKLDAGVTLKDGAVCCLTAYLDEPISIPGDDSPLLPFLVVRWTHDGSGALSTRSTTVRVVCSNTDEMSQAESKKLGTDFTFRHTRNWKARVEDAKLAVRGMRLHAEAYEELARELATIPVTNQQRDLFITTFLPMPPEALISDRVANNVEEARNAVRALFNGPTIPVAHRNTAYGLRLAGTEYLDHLRGYRNSDTYVGRQLLRTEPAKAKLTSLIREVVAA